MSRLNWNVPEGRFFDTGLDRGVLYPKGTPPLGDILFTNHLANPSFGTNTSGWVGGQGTLSRVAEGSGWAGEYVSSALSAGNNAAYVPLASSIAVVPTEKVAFSVDLMMQGASSNYQLELQWFTSGDVSAGSTTIATAVSSQLSLTEYTRLSGEGVVPATAAKVRPRIVPSNGLAAGAGFRFDNAMLTKGDEIPSVYFDGDSVDTNAVTYEWTGTPHESTSIAREIRTLAVPWLGLQSVDEEGGDGAASYYIDGRPFLFLPRPKEFKATLKAVTYPDAFSQIMGVQEVADGMYLDSQPGDSFDLSYRTLVGNATDGVDHGYKIHLVYNCTVAPQALTYESLSNSINPTSFSWEIQAVPVTVEGFRPTAHIIIDTRHMDQSKIDAVESLLYGGVDDVAKMPSPQVIFDLLSFGDTIIVTDNGDGTFDVTGSYENVYMVGNGIFRVDNVDGTDNGDGTFTISTTTE